MVGSFELNDCLLRQGKVVELTLEEAFPTATPEQLAKLREPVPPVTLYVTAYDLEKKTVTFGTCKP